MAWIVSEVATIRLERRCEVQGSCTMHRVSSCDLLLPTPVQHVKPSILVGPSSLVDRRLLVDELTNVAQIVCVDERDAFRRSVAAGQHQAVVLFDTDRDGIPNEPL